MRAAVIGLLLAAACFGKELPKEEREEFYRLGAVIQHKQILTANERIIELEARIRAMELEKETAAALAEMERFRERVLGNAACTINERDLSVKCPPKKK